MVDATIYCIPQITKPRDSLVGGHCKSPLGWHKATCHKNMQSLHTPHSLNIAELMLKYSDLGPSLMLKYSDLGSLLMLKYSDLGPSLMLKYSDLWTITNAQMPWLLGYHWCWNTLILGPSLMFKHYEIWAITDAQTLWPIGHHWYSNTLTFRPSLILKHSDP